MGPKDSQDSQEHKAQWESLVLKVKKEKWVHLGLVENVEIWE